MTLAPLPDLQQLPGTDSAREAEHVGVHAPAWDADVADTVAAPSEDAAQDAAPAEQKTQRPRPARPTDRALTPRVVRMILVKYNELVTSDPVHVGLLAGMLGVKPDPIDITAHLVSARRVQLSGADELAAIAAAAKQSPFAAMAAATQHESKADRVWALLAALGLVTGSIPGKESAAALAIAEAAMNVTSEHLQVIEQVRDLARKN